MEDGLLSLKWNSHMRTFANAISQYRDKALYTDVTLACNGQYFHAHKIILSSCSEYFQEIFTITQCKQPVIVLKDIRSEDVEQLLQYIYVGEVEVKQSELDELIKTAECLKIKGLAKSNNNTDEIPNKSKRKRELSGDRPESPKKQTKSISSNLLSDESTSNQSTHLNEPIEQIKTEPVDVDIIEGIGTKFELDILQDKSVHYDNNSSIDNSEEKELPYIDNENMELSNPSIPVEYLPEYEPEAGSSGINEDSSFDNSALLDDSIANQESNQRKNLEAKNYCIKKKTGKNTIYNCTLCKYFTPNKGIFTIHFRKHTGEKPFKCQFCDYCAAQKHDVKMHEKIHTGEKPYCCQYCGYRAARKYDVQKHELMHTGEKPFSCNQCQYRTTYKQNLKYHVLKKHG